jgi:hypothetical protein
MLAYVNQQIGPEVEIRVISWALSGADWVMDPGFFLASQ